ncbi:MAG: hypothetical protein ACYTDW_00240 [Planctomycetota bacterium]|jgi:hypothetical protein
MIRVVAPSRFPIVAVGLKLRGHIKAAIKPVPTQLKTSVVKALTGV